MSDLFTYAAQQQEARSPFDALKQTDDYGIEVWSARDLMPMAGYSKWQDFHNAISRAATSAGNQGHDPQSHFMGAHKVIHGGRWGSQTIEDIKVTRFGCYLIFQNGDPRKPEIANAQGYFAIQTRIAESASQPPALPQSYAEALRELAANVDAKELAEKRAEISEARVELIEGGTGFSVREFHKHYFLDVPERQLTELLYAKNLLIDQRGQRVNSKGQRVPGKQHRHPSWKGKPFFFLDPFIDEDGVRHYHTKVRPGSPEVALVELLRTYGLASNSNRSATTTKELT